MPIMGCSFDEVRHFTSETSRVRRLLQDNCEYRERVLSYEKEYSSIKEFFTNFIKFLKYTSKVNLENFYRIRKLKNNNPFTDRKELIYPDPYVNHKDRMNNTSFRALYVALHEFTAMAETRLDKSYINKYFQLTKFTTKHEFTVFKLGFFSELHLNTPRDSKYVKNEMKNVFDSEYHDRTVQGYSALECAIADVLYDRSDGYHILSSILADAIFTENQKIDAILYPSMQNRYGLNLAIKKEFADTLEISYTSSNQLTDVYDNGFYKYSTLKECVNYSNSNSFVFTETEGCCCFR